MSPHVERMEAELDELTVKVSKLEAFILSNLQFNDLPAIDQMLLVKQAADMRQYGDTLSLRLQRANV